MDYPPSPGLLHAHGAGSVVMPSRWPPSFMVIDVSNWSFWRCIELHPPSQRGHLNQALFLQPSPVPRLNTPLEPPGPYKPSAGSAKVKVQTIPAVLGPHLLPLPHLSSVHHHLTIAPTLLIPACPSVLGSPSVPLRVLLQQSWDSAPAKHPVLSVPDQPCTPAYATGTNTDHNSCQ